MGETLGLQVMSILLYPGLALAGAAGFLCELALTRRPAGVIRALTPPSGAAIAAAGLAGLAGAQIAAPFSPADGADRNLLVALVAAVAVACLAWATGGAGRDRVFLAGAAAVTLALLLPAVLAQELHPQVVGVGGLQASAIRAGCAALYLLGAAALLRTLAGSQLRLWLWLPLGGLFSSVFLPPLGDDAIGAAEFFGAAAAALALAAILSRLARSVV
jgi:hypothetical protein